MATKPHTITTFLHTSNFSLHKHFNKSVWVMQCFRDFIIDISAEGKAYLLLLDISGATQ